MDWIIPLFSRLHGRLGSFAILGNHDLVHEPSRLLGLLGDAGFTNLEGAWATVQAEGKTIALGGTSFPWGPPLSMGERPHADLSIYLSHTPDLFYQAEHDGFDLMLSGHNHGGQIRLPLIGPVFMPSRYWKALDRGFFRKNHLTLHVSQGMPASIRCVTAACPRWDGSPSDSAVAADSQRSLMRSNINATIVNIPFH